MTPRFGSVVLDVDSTVSGVEGIDWLAARRGPDTATRISELTDRAMRGEISLESIYGARLAEIRPTRADIAALADEYVARMAPGCREAVARLQEQDVTVVLVSGGIRQAIEPLAAHLGIASLSAVDVWFDVAGEYVGFDESSPLARSGGKPVVVESLALTAPVLAVGDGSTDVEMKPVVAAFAAFTGFAARPNVVEKADLILASFDSLASAVLT